MNKECLIRRLEEHFASIYVAFVRASVVLEKIEKMENEKKRKVLNDLRKRIDKLCDEFNDVDADFIKKYLGGQKNDR